MGRIKPTLVKRTTRQLIAQSSESFGKTFEENKSQITKLQKQETQITKNKDQATENSTQIQDQASNLKKFKTLFTKPTQTTTLKTKALQILRTPTSTIALSKKLKIGRSYTSKILNQLEKDGKIYQHSRAKQTILYKKR